MNILHVLSQVEVTGAETYAAALVAQQVKDGHQVTVVSDTFATPLAAEHLPMPIARRSYPRRLSNVVALRRLLRRRGIHLVHAHSRAASWVAYFATRATGVPLVSTLHALQPLHPTARAFSVYGEQVIVVSPSVEQNAVRGLGLPRERVHLVPNGVDLEHFRPADAGAAADARRALGIPVGAPLIALVGRLSGPRFDAARLVVSEVLPRLRASVPDARLVVAGGMRVAGDFAAVVVEANGRLGEGAVLHLGHVADVRSVLAAADVVIAAGRSALEALAVERPVVALGETHYVGVVDEATAAEARRTNFGDTGARAAADAARVAGDVAGLLRDPAARAKLGAWGRSFVERHYAAAALWPRVREIYRRARAARLPAIPVLMYHRVVASAADGGRHGIWVTRDRFAGQLASLARRGFTPVTFGDVAACLEGGAALPRRPVILTFDDGYADNHALALPLLREHGMRAVVFLIGDPAVTTNAWDAAGTPGEPPLPLLTDAQVREMAAARIEFGSHTLHHARLTDLGPAELAEELEGSRRALERRLGAPVTSVCYPWGAVNPAVKAATAAAGYAFGVASDSGPPRFGADLFEIRRVQVFPGTDGFGFWKKTSRWYADYRRLVRRR